MVLKGVKPEDVAEQWAGRIRERMESSGNFDPEEVDELFNVIKSFTKTAVELLQEEPVARVPNSETALELNDDQAHLVIELFLRGVNQVAKRLRDKGLPWEQRRDILESLSWKIFNLSKLLIGLQNQSNQPFQQVLKSSHDLKTMMKHSAEELLTQELREAGV